jgi:hypothetical protein
MGENGTNIGNKLSMDIPGFAGIPLIAWNKRENCEKKGPMNFRKFHSRQKIFVN